MDGFGETERNQMPETYGLDCPLARTLDIVGERWSILVLRDLFLHGPRKFQDFQNSLSGVSPNILSARLKRLEEADVIERRFYVDHPPRAEYVLTANPGNQKERAAKARRPFDS